MNASLGKNIVCLELNHLICVPPGTDPLNVVQTEGRQFLIDVLDEDTHDFPNLGIRAVVGPEDPGHFPLQHHPHRGLSLSLCAARTDAGLHYWRGLLLDDQVKFVSLSQVVFR